MVDNTDQEQKEYNDFIKSSVADGTFFRDARDWYIFRYVEPICQRTILFFANVIAALITYILIITISNALPMKEEKAIVIRSSDQSRYFPVIKPLRDSVELKSVDEAVLKYIVTNYVKKREDFDLRKTSIEILNNQMNYVRNNSVVQEYKDFQNFLNRENSDSPLIYFGKDFQRSVEVESVEFINKDIASLADQAKYFVTSEVPQSANVRFNVTIKINSVATSSQKYLAKINFKFSGIGSKNNGDQRLDFLVTSYKIFKIK